MPRASDAADCASTWMQMGASEWPSALHIGRLLVRISKHAIRYILRSLMAFKKVVQRQHLQRREHHTQNKRLRSYLANYSCTSSTGVATEKEHLQKSYPKLAT